METSSLRVFGLFVSAFAQLVRGGAHLPADPSSSPCSSPSPSPSPPVCGTVSVDKARIAVASSIIVASSLQPYCTTLLGYTTPGATTTTYEDSTPTSTIYEILYTSTTYRSTVYYEETSKVIVTPQDDLRRRQGETATPSPTPTALASFDACVLSSACAGIATVNTSTVTAGNFVSFTLTTETTATTYVDSVLYIPTGTVTTTTTQTLLCGAPGRENTLFALPPAGDGNVLTSDRSAGSENCSIVQGQSYIYQNPGVPLLSVAVGKRANGLTYCDWFQYSAREMRRNATTLEGAPEGWEYWDKGCFE